MRPAANMLVLGAITGCDGAPDGTLEAIWGAAINTWEAMPTAVTSVELVDGSRELSYAVRYGYHPATEDHRQLLLVPEPVARVAQLIIDANCEVQASPEMLN